ncbi:MAG: rod shape-determining protein MreD [Firmicutes bacterium]|nr:rod shape-determining protein MreD [Bacillota bacterium]
MKYVKVFIIYITCFLIEHTFLSRMMPGGVSPDLIMVLTVIITLFYGTYEGIVAGVVIGIFQDICFSPVLGISAFMYFIIGAGVLMVRDTVADDSRMVMLVLTTVATVIYYGGSWCTVRFLLAENIGLLYVLARIPWAIVLNFTSAMVAWLFFRDSREKKRQVI